MSLRFVLAKPHISADNPNLEISLAARFSPSELMGVPSSIESTPTLSNCLAISNFSSVVKDTPGVCSPSLNVVSNIRM